MTVQRVLLSINVRWWNAEAAYALNVAEGLMQKGKEAWVIVNKESPVHQKALDKGIPVVTDLDLDSRSLRCQLNNLKKLILFIDSNKIDLINSFKSNGALLFTILRKLRPRLIYIKTRGEARPPKNHPINRYLYGPNGCNGIIASGEIISNWLKDLKLGNQQIRTIYYGAKSLNVQREKQDYMFREEFGIDENKIVLALLGRTQPIKGHLLLLETLNQLKELPIHILFLVKDLNEFPEENRKIQEYISTHNLSNKVTTLGFRDDLSEILGIVDIGIIPSLGSEVNCRVAVEFFSMGIPIVAFPTGTLPEIIDHKKNGYICDQKSSKSLSDGINWMFINDFKKLNRFSKDKYLQCYTLDKLTEETLSFYEACLHS